VEISIPSYSWYLDYPESVHRVEEAPPDAVARGDVVVLLPSDWSLLAAEPSGYSTDHKHLMSSGHTGAVWPLATTAELTHTYTMHLLPGPASGKYELIDASFIL